MDYDTPDGPEAPAKSGKLSRRAKEKLLEDARKRFRLVLDAESEQRKNELEDLTFQIPELQWTDAARREREGSQGSGGLPVPPRPLVSIDKLAQPRAKILNEARQAHLGIQIHPRSIEASDDTAEMQRGLYRKIEADSRAAVARIWALDRASQCGRGYYRVSTKYDEDGENPFDQIISIDRILYQDTVYFDPSSTKSDFSDAKWCFVIGWMTVEDYKQQFPNAEIPSEQYGWEAMGQSCPDWVRVGDDRPVLVAEHWYKVTERERIQMLSDGKVLREGERMPEPQPGQEPVTVIAERDVQDEELHYCKLSAFDVLDMYEWPIPYIPIIPVIGKEMQTFEGKRRWTGIVRNSREPQRAYNWAFSGVIEKAALEPKAPFIATKEQIEGYEAMWSQSNTRSFPVLYYNAQSDGSGSQLPAPQRMQVGTASMSVMVELVGLCDQALQSTTAIYDPSLGRVNQKEQSGKAIKALQAQATLTTSDYTQNLAEISMTYEALVILAWIPIVYDRPGRVLHILDMEGQTRPVMLNAPYVDEGSGKMRRLPPPVPGMPAPIGAPGAKVKDFDLRKGVYTANVTVGRALDTLREEANMQLGQIMESNPEMALIVGPIFYKNQDFPGHAEVAELMLEMREQKYPGLGKKDQGPDPRQLQSQLQQQGEQIRQMGQALEGAQKFIETKQAEQEAKIEAARVQASAQMEIAKMEIASKILIARINSKNEMENQAREDQEERIALQQELTHAASIQNSEQVHQAMMGRQQHEQGMEQGMMGHEQKMTQAEQGHGQAMEQAEQGAALQPPPQGEE